MGSRWRTYSTYEVEVMEVNVLDFKIVVHL